MSSSESDADAAGRDTIVVIPLRSLREGKLRLRPRLTDSQRSELIATMADAVVRAAHELPVLVVFDDPDVAAWASARGACGLRPASPGLNAAVTAARDHVSSRGFRRMVVAHADLPRATDLRPVADFDGITIVPDRLGDGTNVLSIPTAIEFVFSYGPGSFDAHRRLAAATGLPVRILDDPDLCWDVDHPDDLDHADVTLSGDR